MKLTDLKLNSRNPRQIKDDKFKKLCHSLKQDPDFTDKMMKKRQIVIDKDNVILAGNMRCRAFKELGMTEIPNEWVVDGTDFTPEQMKRFIVEDNLAFGEINFDILSSDFEIEELKKWGFDEKDLNIETDIKEKEIDENLETKNECPKCKYKW